MRNQLLIGSTALICAGMCGRASAINVVLDYSFDAANGNYFGTHATAKAAVDAAAARVSSLIMTELATTEDTVTGTNGDSTATFNLRLNFTNPSTGAAETRNDAVVPEDEVRIYVGRRNLTGDTLGQGGAGAAGFQGSVGGSTANRQGAVTNAAAKASTNLRRGDGPHMRTLSDDFADLYPYTITSGATLGHMWFDSDTDDSGGTDNDATFESKFHINHTTAVAAGKSDLYSVALHEITHAIGFSFSTVSFAANVPGGDSNDWTGARVIAERGNGDEVLENDSSHILDNLTSTAFAGGLVTAGTTIETLMGPRITTGTRKDFTRLDLAFLEDFGWDTALPEPSAASLLLAALPLLTGRRTRRAKA